jgi:hypothetical protein
VPPIFKASVKRKNTITESLNAALQQNWLTKTPSLWIDAHKRKSSNRIDDSQSALQPVLINTKDLD